MKSDTSINLNKSISTSEATILHNNGKPIKTDLFEKKQGNELFAVSMYTENGVKHKAYYMTNESSININNKLYEIVLDNKKDPEILNQKIGDSRSLSVSPASAAIDDYKCDFYTTLPNGVHRQQGSLATSVEAIRKSSNTSINGTNGSVWDVSSYSQLKARSDESIIIIKLA
jgi:hypothetical protein